MIGEIIAIGDELVTGRIDNTTSGYAARKLHAAGYTIRSIQTIGDSLQLIGPTLLNSLEHADFIIVTGGLGATTDDLTNKAVIETLNLQGEVNPQVIAGVKTRRPDLDKVQMAAIEKLAWLPKDVTILDDTYRMAGYILLHNKKPIFFLPGVPPQMEYLLTTRVLPELQNWFPDHQQKVNQQVYKTFGLYESEINRQLIQLENQPSVHIGYYPVGCEVHISLTVTTDDQDKTDTLFATIDATIRSTLGNYIFGTGKVSMAEAVGKLLLQQKQTFCIAESCTGGLIGSQVTKIAGSSQWFAGGVIAYSNDLKESLLNVDRTLLQNYGAVSSQAARAMAARLAAKTKCNTGVSVTGIAGPGGGSEEKPVGTVYIGLFHNNKVSDTLYNFSGSRRQIQEKSALTALDTVRRALLDRH